jgi:hypothetical protein
MRIDTLWESQDEKEPLEDLDVSGRITSKMNL